MENVFSNVKCNKQTKVSDKLLQIMKEEMKNGWRNTIPLIDPTGEYERQFHIKIGVELWRKTIIHFFDK